MGMSTHCVGFRPANDSWNKMKTVWENCEAAGVPVPDEVKQFFNFESPGDKPGQEVPLGESLSEYSCENKNGYEVDVTKLPPGITTLRFYNSW